MGYGESLAIVVLPGSFNPPHCEHVRSLELARQHLEQKGVTVVAGFLQPSSDSYVTQKVGHASAIRLDDRITMCEIAGEANAKTHNGEQWIHAWSSGQTNGFGVPEAIGKFLNATLH